MQNEKI